VVVVQADAGGKRGSKEMRNLLFRVAMFGLITGACTSFLAVPYLVGG
jgi:hypothetical protein